MVGQLIKGNHWLEPIVPSYPGYPADVLELADSLLFLADQLDSSVAPETAKQLGNLMRLTNSFYSNLIEGYFTEPVELSKRVKCQEAKALGLLGITHIHAQAAFDRRISLFGAYMEWWTMFDPSQLKLIHRRLFEGANEAGLRASKSRMMTPGQMRDESQRDVLIGTHFSPSWECVTPMLRRLQQVYGSAKEPRSQLLASMAYHHRLAFVHPFEDGNGRVIRMITHLQLKKIGLASSLWSISRGLASKRNEYYARLNAADQMRRGDLDGRGQLTQAGLIEFVRFMLLVCQDQLQYMRGAMSTPTLRNRLESIVQFEPRFMHAGIRPEAAQALLLLISQGQLSRADFQAHFNLQDEAATNQLGALIELEVVLVASPESHEVYPAFPVWFAQLLFSDLHQRFH